MFEKVYVSTCTLPPVSASRLTPAPACTLVTLSLTSQRKLTHVLFTSLSQDSQVANFSTLISCLSFNHCASSNNLSKSLSAVFFLIYELYQFLFLNFYIGGVWVDLGVYWFPRDAMTNYHKNWWLKTTEIYFITFLEARSLKSASLD